MDKEMMELLQTIPKDVWLQLYNDAPQPMLRQFGRLGEDLAKTLRLVTLPLQCSAYLQDRIDRGFARALKEVPDERRIVPPEGLALDIAEKLKHHDCETLVGRLYVELLSASMDKERSHQAHPAFLPIIGQLSSDEAFFLLNLSKNTPSIYVRDKQNWDVVSQTERDVFLEDVTISIENIETKLKDITLKPEDYFFPENFYIYIEHLNELGLLEYGNNYSNNNWEKWQKITAGQYDMWFIRLSKFGRLFFQCCSAALDNVNSQLAV
ncbi:Abi-alpha family protein [Serratia ureilytica]|uniref:Abi-alpha family protein n=1 Tax=Serratia ureilytica TaxID=300181 RepID=UPI001865EE14|nr:Abi-alpha family protein [Serratia ureilytica]